MIAIPKTADAINVTEFRPITLLSCMGKFERIISERLHFIFEVSNSLSPFQFGFRSNKSSSEQLVRIIQDVHNGWLMGMDTVFVSFDVKKAFDTMWHDGLLYKLNQLGIKGRMLRWIASYLCNRPSKVCVDGVSEQYSTDSGVPQGGVLSPLLFIIYNNDSLVGLTEAIKGSLFALSITFALLHFNHVIDFLFSTKSLATMSDDDRTLLGWSLSYRAKFQLVRAENHRRSSACLSLAKQAKKDCSFILQHPQFKAEALPNNLKIFLQHQLEKAKEILFHTQTNQEVEAANVEDSNQQLDHARSVYNKSATELRKEILKAKNESWKKAINSINVNTAIQEIWSIVKKLGRKTTKRPRHARPFLVKGRNQMVQSEPSKQAESLAENWE